MWPTTKVQSSKFKVQSLGLNLGPRTLNLERGFTFLEFLIASMIFIIVILAVYLMYETNQATFAKGEKDADLQQNARVAMDRLVRELRMAGFDIQATPIIDTPSDTTRPCDTAIQSATATSIRFIADVDPDPTPNSGCPSPPCTERVEYSYDAAQKRIKREEWPRLTSSTSCNDSDWSASGGAKSLAEKISGLTFAYCCDTNADGNVSLSEITLITVTITASDTIPGQGTRSYTVTSEVRPRNLGL